MRLPIVKTSILLLVTVAWGQACMDEPQTKSSTGTSDTSAGTTSGATTGAATGATSATTGTSSTAGPTTGVTSGTGGSATTASATVGTGGSGGSGGSNPTTTTTGVAGAGGSDPTTTTTGAGGTAPSTMGNPNDPPAPLPYQVDSLHIASGYMGDGATPGAIAEDPTMSCMTSRPTGAVGKCHKFTYTPVTGGPGWAGVYWQFPVNNWGMQAGKRVAPGATKITFFAAGAKGGEDVKFIVGENTTALYTDGASGSTEAMLTTTMTKYTIDITGQMYDGVIGAFGWTAAAPAGAGADAAPISITFTVDSIQWEQ